MMYYKGNLNRIVGTFPMTKKDKKAIITNLAIMSVSTLLLAMPKPAFAETYKMKYCEDFSSTGQYVVCQDFEEERTEKDGVISITASNQSDAIAAVENQRDLAYANNQWMTRPNEANRIKWVQKADEDINEQRSKVAEQVQIKNQEIPMIVPQEEPKNQARTERKEFCVDWGTKGTDISCWTYNVQYDENGNVIYDGYEEVRKSMLKMQEDIYDQFPEIQKPEILIQWKQRYHDDSYTEYRKRAAKDIYAEIEQNRANGISQESSFTALGGDEPPQELNEVTGIEFLDNIKKIPSAEAAEQAVDRKFCKINNWTDAVSCLYEITGDRKYELALVFKEERPELIAALANKESFLFAKYATEQDKKEVEEQQKKKSIISKAEKDIERYQKERKFIMPNGQEYTGSEIQKTQAEKFRIRNDLWKNLVLKQEQKKVEKEEQKFQEQEELRTRIAFGIKAIAGIAITAVVLAGASLIKQIRDKKFETTSQGKNIEIEKSADEIKNKALEGIYSNT